MSQATSHTLETLLQLAAAVRMDHEVAEAANSRNPDVAYPANLRLYVQHVKALVGDWDSRDAAQTSFAPAKALMQASLTRAVQLFPGQFSARDAQQLLSEQPINPEDSHRILAEVSRFWKELSKATDSLGLLLLAIKYNLQPEIQ